MDPNYYGYGYDDTYSLSPSRSRARSRGPSTSPTFAPVDIRSPSTSSVEGTISPAYLSPVPSHTDAYLSPSIAEHYQFAAIPQGDSLTSDWVEGQAQEYGTPVVRVDSVSGYPTVLNTNGEETMCTAALAFDPTSLAMSNRSSFSWSHMPAGTTDAPYPSLVGTTTGSEHNPNLLSASYSYGAHSEHTLSPPSTTRSISPTDAAILSSDDPQDSRRISRQHSQARRQARTQHRAQRGSASPYAQPASIPINGEESHVPVYSSTATTMSMLASPPATIAPQYSYTDASQPAVYSYGNTTAPSQSYMASGSQDYYSAYTQQPPVTSPYGAPASAQVAYSSLPHHPQVMSPPVPERIVQQRPKPQCWEHGCNGRQFSTFSNLLRHQREKSGQATKSTCEKCGAEFTRTTARNGHMAHNKCKARRTNSDAGSAA